MSELAQRAENPHVAGVKNALFAAALFLVSEAAAVDLDHPIASVALKDGRTLTQLEIVGYSQNVLTAKWQGGRGTIAYDQLPEEIALATAGRRPAPLTDEQKAAFRAQAMERARLSREQAEVLLAAQKVQREAEALAEKEQQKARAVADRENRALQEKIETAMRTGMLVVGMTPAQVIRAIGEPRKKNISTGIYGTHEQWVYEKGYVYFENGVLTAWQN